MKIIKLREGSELFHVTYQGGNFTNNLSASHFRMSITDDEHTIELNVSKNLNSRTVYVRDDAKELLEQVRSSKVEFIQLLDPVASEIATVWDSTEEIPRIIVKLDFGNIAYKSDVTPAANGLNIFLKCHGEFVQS